MEILPILANIMWAFILCVWAAGVVLVVSAILAILED